VPKWKEFEVLIAKIQSELAPSATVEHNRRIRGRSGRSRQVDIAVTQSIGIYPVLIAVECKRYRRSVKLDKVEAFVTKLRDIGANQGVMISATGFDEGAKAIARENGVTLLSYRQATEADWRKAVGPECWIRLVKTECVRCSLLLLLEDQHEEPVGSYQTLCSGDGAQFLIADIVRDFVGMARVQRPVGQFVGFVEPEEPLFLSEGATLKRVHRLRVEGENKSWGILANAALASGHILIDAFLGENLFQQFFTEGLHWQSLLQSPGCLELTAEEIQAYPQGTRFSLEGVKQYIRLVWTVR